MRWWNGVSRVKQYAAATLFAAAAFLPTRALAQDTTLASRTLGARSAPVTVYEMADFQCPYCRDFALQTFPTLKKEYIATGKVKWIFINFPLPMHGNAEPAAEFAMCAARQDRFWQTHDMLYGTQEQWEQLKDPVPFFMAKAGPIGLNRGTLTDCLKSGAGKKVVDADLQGDARAGAQSTPSFYIEGGMMAGNAPLQTFRKVLDSVYAAKKK